MLALLIFFKALKKLDLSLAIPLLSFTPIFMLLSSFILLGEFPSLLGILGMILVVSGIYVLNLPARFHVAIDTDHPGQRTHRPGVIYAPADIRYSAFIDSAQRSGQRHYRNVISRYLPMD